MLNEIDRLIFRVNSLVSRFKEVRSENINLADQINNYESKLLSMKEICGKKELEVVYWKDRFIELERSSANQAEICNAEISRMKEVFENQSLEVTYWKDKAIDSEKRILSLVSEKDDMENALTGKLKSQEENYKEKETLMKDYEHKLRDVLLSQESKISRMRNNVQSAINHLSELANKLPGVFSVEDDINGAS